MNWARFVWRYLSYRKGLLATLFVCAAVMAAAELSIPWLIKEAIDAVVDETRPIDLNAWVGVTLAILAALYLAHVVLLRVAAHVIMPCSFHFPLGRASCRDCAEVLQWS